MSDRIVYDSQTYNEIARRLSKAADSLRECVSSLPCLLSSGCDLYNRAIRGYRSKGKEASQKADSLVSKINKANRMFCDAESNLVKSSENHTTVEGNDISTYVGVLKTLLRFHPDLQPLFMLYNMFFGNKYKGNPVPAREFERSDCEAQSNLALGIYDGFDNGSFALSLSAIGYSVVTIKNPAGVAAFRIGADNVPEVQIVYRGSQTREDWATNFSFATNSEGFHTGFAEDAKSFLSILSQQKLGASYGDATFGQLFSGAAEQGLPLRINITGHSLGGAEAQITTAYLLKNGISPESITTYTFGSPDVANPTGQSAKYLDNAQIYNVANQHDFVTMAGAGGITPLQGKGNLGTTYTFDGASSRLSDSNTYHRAPYSNIPYDQLVEN